MSSPIPSVPDVRLVVTDLDGTLLDERGRVPDGLWPLLERLHERGIVFAPASGRQYASLARSFTRPGSAAAARLTYIAENGSHVVRDGVEVASVTLAPAVVREAVRLLRAVAVRGHDLGVVVCGKQAAYVERTDEAFLRHVRPYYAALREVEDLDAVVDGAAGEGADEVVKVAAFSFASGAELAPELADLAAQQRVVVSGQHWVDVMAPQANKGVAVAALQAELGVTREQTVAFGDYLNDLEMLDAAAHSFAMADAHPEVLARARHVAPSHREQGVVRTLEALLDASTTPSSPGGLAG